MCAILKRPLKIDPDDLARAITVQIRAGARSKIMLFSPIVYDTLHSFGLLGLSANSLGCNELLPCRQLLVFVEQSSA